MVKGADAMKREDVIKFSNENQVCFLSTIDDNKPKVRAVKLWFADESGFYFEIMSDGEISRQLHQNPNVEICFYNDPGEMKHAQEMLLSGKISFIANAEILREAYLSRPVQREFGNDMSHPNVEVVHLTHGDATFMKVKGHLIKVEALEHVEF